MSYTQHKKPLIILVLTGIVLTMTILGGLYAFTDAFATKKFVKEKDYATKEYVNLKMEALASKVSATVVREIQKFHHP